MRGQKVGDVVSGKGEGRSKEKNDRREEGRKKKEERRKKEEGGKLKWKDTWMDGQIEGEGREFGTDPLVLVSEP